MSERKASVARKNTLLRNARMRQRVRKTEKSNRFSNRLNKTDLASVSLLCLLVNVGFTKLITKSMTKEFDLDMFNES